MALFSSYVEDCPSGQSCTYLRLVTVDTVYLWQWRDPEMRVIANGNETTWKKVNPSDAAQIEKYDNAWVPTTSREIKGLPWWEETEISSSDEFVLCKRYATYGFDVTVSSDDPTPLVGHPGDKVEELVLEFLCLTEGVNWLTECDEHWVQSYSSLGDLFQDISRCLRDDEAGVPPMRVMLTLDDENVVGPEREGYTLLAIQCLEVRLLLLDEEWEIFRTRRAILYMVREVSHGFEGLEETSAILNPRGRVKFDKEGNVSLYRIPPTILSDYLRLPSRSLVDLPELKMDSFFAEQGKCAESFCLDFGVDICDTPWDLDLVVDCLYVHGHMGVMLSHKNGGLPAFCYFSYVGEMELEHFAALIISFGRFEFYPNFPCVDEEGNDLYSYPVTADPAERGKGKLFIDSDGNGYCPLTGELLTLTLS